SPRRTGSPRRGGGPSARSPRVPCRPCASHLLVHETSPLVGGLAGRWWRCSQEAASGGLLPTRGCLRSLATGSCLGRGFDGLLLSFEIVCDVAGPRRVDVDARAHRGRQRDLLDVPALRRSGLRTDHLADPSGAVLAL